MYADAYAWGTRAAAFTLIKYIYKNKIYLAIERTLAILGDGWSCHPLDQCSHERQILKEKSKQDRTPLFIILSPRHYKAIIQRRWKRNFPFLKTFAGFFFSSFLFF
jgi:hypothetical protein